MILYSQTLISKANLTSLIKDAFLSPPWCEDLSEEECQKRATNILNKRAIQCFSAEIAGRVVGVILTDTVALEDLRQERGVDLYNWALKMQWENIGWGRESLILREYQSMGIGSILREKVMDHIAQTRIYSGLLTRMRDDNIRVIKIAEKFGYIRTGVRVKSSLGENIWHEFWYKVF